MIASIQGVSKIYGMLLRLFPRDFQKEFREEMVDVFTANLEEAAKTSTTLVVRVCIFELIDLPVNLIVEHFSNLRKGNFMKTLSYEVGRSRAVLMGALGMGVGWVLNNLFGEYFSYHGLRELPFTLVGLILFTIPVGVRQNFAKVSNLTYTLHTKGIFSVETSGIEDDSAAQSWLAKK
jgi:hypothetical protein